MSLVTSIDFFDITKVLTEGAADSTFTQNSNVTYNGTTVNTHLIRTSAATSSTQITFETDKANFNNVLINDTDFIHLSFDVYVKDLNGDVEIAECSIDGDIVLYQKGHSTGDITDKISVNYLIKSSRISNLINNIGTLDILFKLYCTDGANIRSGDLLYIDREIKLYAIYKPFFKTITPTNVNASAIHYWGNGYNEIKNKDAYLIQGGKNGSSSGSCEFNIKDKLITNKPVSIFFTIKPHSIEGGDEVNVYVNDNLIYNSNVNNIIETFFYSQTENYTSGDFKIKFEINNINGNAIQNGDYIIFDDVFTYIPEAINFFDTDVEIDGSVDIDGLVYNSGVVGEIGMFYENLVTPPFGYLWCDGTQITTDSSTTGGDEKYRNLIELLKKVDKNSTTGNQSAYLPMLENCYGLGGGAGDLNGVSYNTSSGNFVSDSKNNLDINYFPNHSHNSHNVEFTYNYTASPAIQVSLTKTDMIENDGTYYYTGKVQRHNTGKKGNAGNNVFGASASNTYYHSHSIGNPSYNIHNMTLSSNLNQHTGLSHNGNITIQNTGNFIGSSSVEHQPKSFQLKAAIRYL